MKRNLPLFVGSVVPGSVPGAAAGNGTVIERSNYRSAFINLAVATVAASSSIVAKIQTGDAADGSDMADYVIDTDSQGNNVVPTTATLSVSNTNATLDVDLGGAKKYIRIVTTATGTAPTFQTSIVLGDPQYGDGFNAEQ